MYGKGVSREGTVLDLAVENNIVKKSGTWFSYGETRVGQGRDSAKQFLETNPTICNEIETKLRDLLLAKPVEEPAQKIPVQT
jgi:recombination protein RecA